jgi:hypothetical protein
MTQSDTGFQPVPAVQLLGENFGELKVAYSYVASTG